MSDIPEARRLIAVAVRNLELAIELGRRQGASGATPNGTRTPRTSRSPTSSVLATAGSAKC
jgi:hypothetical protein